MDVVLLSRLQFAAAAMFHFLFVPLTLGLSILLAIMEWKYVRSGDETYKRMVKFWGRLFVINFAIGVLTGITLEFQFGTNWARYSAYVGDIFGSLLAIEATVAFFLESTFLAVWIFGWKKVSKKLHAWCITLVALASNISAYWILAANAWMQHPVGYVIRNGRAELESFFAVITQHAAVVEFFHTVTSAYVLAGFFVLGVSAYHLARKQQVDFFGRSFRLAAVWTFVFSIVLVAQGHFNGTNVAKQQPEKLAAFEALWDTKKPAPQALFIIPDPKNERNLVEFGYLPTLLSFLAYNSTAAEVKGLKDFPKEDRPPVILPFFSFRIMVGLGFLFVIISFFAWRWRTKIENKRRFLKWLPWVIPLPYLAIQAGWILAEVGRQPWIVYKVLLTSDAVSPITGTQVLWTFIGFIVFYSFLGVVNFTLLARLAKKGPQSPGEQRAAKEVIP
jgi:cytochrome d ubiquinol oxidase subunit I